MLLSPTDREALHQAFEAGEPVAADYVARFTGLDVNALKAGGVVRVIGRLDTQLYRGSAWPDLPTPELMSGDDLREQREDRQADYDYERKGEGR